MTRAEPRWDIDLPYGKQGECQLGDYLTWIAEGNGRVEVKRKRYLDVEFYVETHCDKGRLGDYRPSGITVTEADMWAFVIADTGLALCVPTELLRAAILHPTARAKEEEDGTCPTRGMLVNVGAMLAIAKGHR